MIRCPGCRRPYLPFESRCSCGYPFRLARRMGLALRGLPAESQEQLAETVEGMAAIRAQTEAWMQPVPTWPPTAPNVIVFRGPAPAHRRVWSGRQRFPRKPTRAMMSGWRATAPQRVPAVVAWDPLCGNGGLGYVNTGEYGLLRNFTRGNLGIG